MSGLLAFYNEAVQRAAASLRLALAALAPASRVVITSVRLLRNTLLTLACVDENGADNRVASAPTTNHKSRSVAEARVHAEAASRQANVDKKKKNGKRLGDALAAVRADIAAAVAEEVEEEAKEEAPPPPPPPPPPPLCPMKALAAALQRCASFLVARHQRARFVCLDDAFAPY